MRSRSLFKADATNAQDVRVVYRDHHDANDNDGNNSHEDSFITASSSVVPLSIDDGYHDSDIEEEDDDDDENDSHNDGAYYHQHRKAAFTPALFITHPHLAVLPVLLLEFLALALTRAVLPSLLLKRYGSRTYIVMGLAECVRGILAFFACPLFGKLSDNFGRRPCLLVTVMGTLLPVCSLAFWKVDENGEFMGMQQNQEWNADVVDDSMDEDNTHVLNGVDAGEASEGSWTFNFGAHAAQHPTMMYLSSIHRIDVFVALLALSGMFSSTFTLTFAYISDVVKDRDGRVAAYGLALATFGLSFTIGPLLGGYLANVDDDGKEQVKSNEDSGETINHSHEHYTHSSSDIHPLGQHRVFITTLVLAVLDLFYIHFLLPESLHNKRGEQEQSTGVNVSVDGDARGGTHANRSHSTTMAAVSSESNAALPAGVGVSRRASSSWWNPLDSIRYLTSDPLLSTIGRVTFLYYTALHAVVSTLILYAARQLHFGPHRLGELMAALGLSTMVSEAVLVRIAIPALGEKRAMRVGLASFAMQCVLLAVADRPWHLFGCAFLAIPGNLVYPSVSSLVSTTVRPEMVGRALGAVNGVKSLTEGVGPLVFGTLLTMSEKDALPGWPYFIAAIMAALAYQAGRALPGDEDDSDSTMLYSKASLQREEYNSSLRDEDEVCGLLDADAR